ncbi:MAG: hypothetical protein IT431_02315 [Phycisphaerales bacterium]|nr:hypothetical protein [Phycisphaerales bacterium]
MQRRFALSLFLALLTTVAIAWLAMCLPARNAWRGPPTTTPLGTARADDGAYWQLSRADDPAHTVVSYWFMQVSGLAIAIPEDQYQTDKYDIAKLPSHLRPRNLTGLNMQAWYHATGWPFRALTCSVHWKQQIRNSDITYTVHGGVQLPRDADFNPRALPLTPVWPGFLLDTAIYTPLWLAMLSALHTLRARRRARRGACPHCSYPRQGLDPQSPCPECGKR